ncbi:hypothetical protein RRG08_042453 [Elysia crispata]|uniref:Uncharacterized protein n=1 Tax=Elysia crispata TaxID=231223 RepID=A0AAE0ZCI5_9GAST|nr:hypothetical protein RRG08_042453 [Elysia crispata]
MIKGQRGGDIENDVDCTSNGSMFYVSGLKGPRIYLKFWLAPCGLNLSYPDFRAILCRHHPPQLGRGEQWSARCVSEGVSSRQRLTWPTCKTWQQEAAREDELGETPRVGGWSPCGSGEERGSELNGDLLTSKLDRLAPLRPR